MKRYKIRYMEDAVADQQDIVRYVYDKSRSKTVTRDYVKGIRRKIAELKTNPERYSRRFNDLLVERYGADVRRVNYKNTAIIYTIVDDTVYIQRIMPASMVLGV